MKITDKMIDDIFDFFSESNKSAKGFLKEHLKERGYKVEETALEKARELYNDIRIKYLQNYLDVNYEKVINLKCFYEEAICELINKMKNCDNCKHDGRADSCCIGKCGKGLTGWELKN
jgi:hypothetical protein